ncbi:cupin domain-containing protein [Candidatus Latescibacterota bacterium]
MRRMIFIFCVFMLVVQTGMVNAQTSLDGKPLDPAKDPDINMFMGDYRDSLPFNSHGNITERAILTKLEGDDELRPLRDGAVLTKINRFSRATMDPHVSTAPTTLKGEQEVFYFVSGTGTITSGGKTADLRYGIFMLVPEEVEFTIKNTGDDLLVMYIINIPIPEGFKSSKSIVVKDETTMPYRKQGFLSMHWVHKGKRIFVPSDGLSVLKVNLLVYDPMTIGHPHSHGEGVEEIWHVLKGKNLAFLGKEIRWQGPGVAYKVPPSGFTPHSNINGSEEPIYFLYLSPM